MQQPPSYPMQPWMPSAQPQMRGTQTLVSAIERAMQDEANANLFYGELARQVTDAALRDYVRHAQEDEQKHFRMLNSLHARLTGRPYEVRTQPTPFTDLRAGLKKAMDDEYEAFEMYRSIYLSQNNPQIRDIFFEIMTDELEHATRFNYVLQSL